MAETWSLVLRRRYRPWWTLWLGVRWREISAERVGTEDDILASAAEMKAEFPRWEFELRRTGA